MIILPVGLAAIAVGELLLPLLLASQRPELLEVARLFMLTIVVVMLYDLLFGMLLGDHGALGAPDYDFPVQRAALPQPAAFAAWNVVVAIVVFRPVYPRHGLRGRAVRSPGRRSGTASAPKSLGSATRSSPGVRLVYGDAFGGSVRPLLYLLPRIRVWSWLR